MKVPKFRPALPSVFPRFRVPKIERKVLHFFLSVFLIGMAASMAVPDTFTVSLSPLKKMSTFEKLPESLTFTKTPIDLTPWGIPFNNTKPLRYGLDIQGGTRVTLRADLSQVPDSEKATALESAQEVLRRRVDMYGVTEPRIRTSVAGDESYILVELPGIDQRQAAVELIGQTAKLEFREQIEDDPEATMSTLAYLESFQPTGLGGEQLERATVQFTQGTNEPVVSIDFNEEGTKLFGQITERNIGKPVGIYLDAIPVSLPNVNEAIYAGTAQISGGFDLETAKLLATQLNAGALPVSIEIVEQETIGAELGQDSLQKSFQAGAIGLILVALFMILLYGWAGFLADLGLIAYGIITLALYKYIPITLTLPGVAGLVLSIGMAVDSNILTFARIKEEQRAGKPWDIALKNGFGRAWHSIKDANFATLSICAILFNPLNWGWLNTSGPVRGFAVTLALGIFVSLFTGVFFSRLLIQLFLKEQKVKS